MTARAKSIVALVGSLILLPLLLMLACPSHDETRKPDGQGPAEDDTGQPAAPKPAPEPAPEPAPSL